MILRKFVISSGLALTVLSGLSHGFGLPKVPGLPVAAGGTNSGAVSADAVDAFLTLGVESNKLIGDSRQLLATALATKEERAKIKSQQDQLQKSLDAKDKKAIEQMKKEISASQDAQILASAGSEQAQANLKNLTVEQRKLVVNSMKNLAYGIMLQQQQVTAGQNMVSAVSANPMLATKLPVIKDTITSMTNNISGSAGYLVKFPQLFKAMGVSAVLPKTVDEKPEVLAADAMTAFDEPPKVSQK